MLVESARARGFDVEHGRKVSDLKLLAKLQHFGAATGLLDFTWSPLIALWFACCKEPTRDGMLFAVDTIHPVGMGLVPSDEKKQDVETIFSPANHSPCLSYWEPTLSGDAMSRILCQRSLFIIGCPLIPGDTEGVIREVLIVKEDKASLLEDLKLLDVEQSSLFQDIYGFSETNSVASPLRKMPDPEDYLVQGNQLYQRGDYAKAIKAYSACITSRPGVCETYFLRGNAKAASGDHEKAIEDYDEAVLHKDWPFLNFNPDTIKSILNPILFMVYFNLGNAKSVLKDYEGALEDYTKAIEQDWTGHDDPALHFNRANTYADLHKFEEAVAEYDEAIRLGAYYAPFNKGNTLVVMGRFEEAVRCYKESEKKGVVSRRFVDDRREVERIIDKIHGQTHEWRLKNDKASGKGIVSIRIPNHQGATEEYCFRGRVGNTGNFGGNRLPGGKGFPGGPGFVVKVGVRNGDEE